jgi:hypothetical protein
MIYSSLMASGAGVLDAILAGIQPERIAVKRIMKNDSIR